MYLEKAGWIVVKINICSMNGFPDLMVMKDGIVFFIETKSEGKTAKPLQQYVHEKLREENFTVHVIDKWDEFLKLGI